jgi:hypothetical protein
MVKVEDLLAQDEVLQKRRTRRANAQAVLVVRDGDALIRGQPLAILGVLVVLAPASLRAELVLGTRLLRPLLVRHAKFPLFLIANHVGSLANPAAMQFVPRLPSGLQERSSKGRKVPSERGSPRNDRHAGPPSIIASEA